MVEQNCLIESVIYRSYWRYQFEVVSLYRLFFYEMLHCYNEMHGPWRQLLPTWDKQNPSFLSTLFRKGVSWKHLTNGKCCCWGFNRFCPLIVVENLLQFRPTSFSRRSAPYWFIYFLLSWLQRLQNHAEHFFKTASLCEDFLQFHYNLAEKYLRHLRCILIYQLSITHRMALLGFR